MVQGATKVALAATLGNLLQGFDNAAIAGALLYLKPEFNLELNPVLEGFVVASSLAGAWVSAVCSGPWSDWLGRRFILCISAFFYLLSATIMAWSPNVYVLVVCRILMGVGTGFSVTLVPAYIAESAPSEIRGQLATLPQLMGSGGLFVAYIIVFLLSLEKSPNWRYMLAMTAIPSLLYLIMAIFYLPESPRWLVSKGRMSEAKKVLQRLRGRNDVAAELALLVEGLEVGAEISLEEWLLTPAENPIVEDTLSCKDDGHMKVYNPEEGISWISTSVADDRSHGFLSRRASVVEPNNMSRLSLVDPMVTLIGSLHNTYGSFSEAQDAFEDRNEQWDEENNQKMNDSQYDDAVVGDLDEQLNSPLLYPRLSSRDVTGRDSHGSFFNRHGSVTQQDYNGSFKRRSSNKLDFPPLSRGNSTYMRHGSTVMPVGSIPESIASVGIGGGWQLAWQWTGIEGQEGNQEGGQFKRVFLLQEGVHKDEPKSMSAISLPRTGTGMDVDAIQAAALVGQPAQFSKDILAENPVGPAMVHPTETATSGPAWKELCEGGVRRALIVGAGLQFLQQFSGINAVLYFVPQILEQSGASMLLKNVGISPNSASILGSSVTTLLMLPCIFLAMRLMDRAGRRQLLLATLPVLLVSIALLVITNIFIPAGLVQAAGSFIGVALYVSTFVMGFGPIPNILGSEIFPTRVRGLCVGICQTTMWTCNIIITEMFPVLMKEIGTVGVFSILAVVISISWVFIFLKVPETKGMPLEVISEFFAMSAKKPLAETE